MRKYLIFFFVTFLAVPSFADDFKVLIFSKTAGFRHNSISNGISMIEQLGLDHHFEVESTEDASLFNATYLEQFEVVVFLSTTGDILDANQQAAFETYINNGGGYVGIHAASDTEYDWPWYGELMGAYFSNHPPGTSSANIKVSDRVHPSTTNLPTSWTRTDEWYNFRENPRGDVHVLATLDESSYNGGTMGYDHPISWCHEYDGGRAWYTAGGHTNASFNEPLFQEHVLGGILYAAHLDTINYDATVDQNFEVSVIDNNPSNPLALAILPDLNILYIERGGLIKLYNPTTGTITTAASLDVDSNREDGLLGIVLDPNFESNQWLYIFYSPAGNEPKQHVSRVTFTDGFIDLATEKVLLEIPTQRDQCCHSGGDLEFDNNGNLYISIGDNTNPFQSDAFTPIDERPGRSAFDAQHTSANTMDFRGKILRIIPEDDGTYSIPTGNLFTDVNEGFPEIFAMGLRNPFRMAIGPDDHLYFGDVGPDANTENASRGPRGHDEFNRTNQAGNFGWPYCIANNQSYVDYDFSNETSGDNFNCDNPVNESPNNTGAISLPPTIPAWIWYNSGNSTTFPAMNGSGGRTALAGAVYEYLNDSISEVQFPAYYDNSVFLYEWARNWIREVKLDSAGNIVKVNPFLKALELKRPIDMAFGPDGAMYVIEWGTGFWGDNEDARIIKISFKVGNQTPIAIAEADTTAGGLPLTVNFDARASYDPDIGNSLSYEWDFEGDGTFDQTGQMVSHTYTNSGTFNALLKVTDNEGLSAFATIVIIAGNTIPVVSLDMPVNGGFYTWGEEIPFKISVSDLEDGSTLDGSIDCEDISGLASIGHDDHIHDLNAIANCEGSFVTQSHGDEADNVFYVFRGSYTDNGAPGVAGISASTAHILQPKQKEAEHFTNQLGIQLESTTDPLGGGLNVGYINNGDYLSFDPMNLQEITHITFRAASAGIGGFVEVRMDAPDGPLLGKRYIPVTGGWQDYDYYTMPVKDLGGSHELFFVFQGNNGFLFNINWIEFHGQGLAIEDFNALKGLNAFYYNSVDFSGTSEKIKDPMITFDWGDEAPIEGFSTGPFSIRWEGFLEVDNTASYNLYTNHTGGSVKVMLDGVEIINQETDGSFTSNPISIIANEKLPIIVEYINVNGPAAISLGWGELQTIHQANLSISNISNNNELIELDGLGVYPNPFRNNIIIENLNAYYINSVELYAASGLLLNEWTLESANKTRSLNFPNLNNGIYFIKIKTTEGIAIEKIVKVN